MPRTDVLGFGHSARTLLCAILLVAPLAAYAGQNDNGPVTLRMKFTPNAVTKYRVSIQGTMVMHAADHPRRILPTQTSMILDCQVTKVNPDGSALILTTTHDLQSKTNGHSTQGVNAIFTPTTLHISPQGKLLSSSGGLSPDPMNSPLSPVLMSGFGALLPAKSVKPGDTWTQNITLMGNQGTAKNTFVSFANIGHFKTAHIRFTAVVPINVEMGDVGTAHMPAITGVLKFTTDFNFAIAEGKIIRSASNGSTTVNMKGGSGDGLSDKPFGGTSTARVTMNILP